MKALTKAMCWEVVNISKDKLNGVGIAVYRKPTSNECYEKRTKNEPSLCQDSDDPNAAWYFSPLTEPFECFKLKQKLKIFIFVCNIWLMASFITGIFHYKHACTKCQ